MLGYPSQLSHPFSNFIPQPPPQGNQEHKQNDRNLKSGHLGAKPTWMAWMSIEGRSRGVRRGGGEGRSGGLGQRERKRTERERKWRGRDILLNVLYHMSYLFPFQLMQYLCSRKQLYRIRTKGNIIEAVTPPPLPTNN